jgi:lipid II:glycine glycyltransferase (peptidoglycan interpeptide bridge formation enzyme)
MSPGGQVTTQQISILVVDDDVNVSAMILKEYDKIVGKKAVYAQFRNQWNMKDAIVMYNDHGYVYENHLDIIIDLGKSESALWSEIHSKRRNEIRRAYKEGTEFKELTRRADIDTIYDILSAVYRSGKLPIVDKSMFVAAFETLYPRDMARFFGATYENEVIGVMCVLLYRKTVYDWFAGSLSKYHSKYPNDLIPWEVFKWAKAHGYTQFDFGGAGRPDRKYGVREYKKKFGGQLVDYGRFEKIYRPVKLKIAKTGYRAWQLLRR